MFSLAGGAPVLCHELGLLTDPTHTFIFPPFLHMKVNLQALGSYTAYVMSLWSASVWSEDFEFEK